MRDLPCVRLLRAPVSQVRICLLRLHSAYHHIERTEHRELWPAVRTSVRWGLRGTVREADSRHIGESAEPRHFQRPVPILQYEHGPVVLVRKAARAPRRAVQVRRGTPGFTDARKRRIHGVEVTPHPSSAIEKTSRRTGSESGDTDPGQARPEHHGPRERDGTPPGSEQTIVRRQTPPSA